MEVQKNALAAKADELWSGREKVPGVGGKVKELTWERLIANREVIGKWQEVGYIS